MIVYKIILISFSTLLLVTDIIRITRIYAARQELKSMLTFILWLAVCRQAFHPPTLLSMQTLAVLGCASAAAVIHLTMHVLNFWFIFDKWEKPLLFRILGYTGSLGLFLLSLWLILGV